MNTVPEIVNKILNYYVNESFPLIDYNKNNSLSSNDNYEDQFNQKSNTSTIYSQNVFNNVSLPTKLVIIEWNSIKWLLIMYSIIFLLATVGNSLVILTLVQNKRMRTITNVYLLNLAISDLFLGVFCMPFTLVGMILRNFMFGEIMCKLLPYLQGEYFLFFYIFLNRLFDIVYNKTKVFQCKFSRFLNLKVWQKSEFFLLIRTI